MQFAIFFLTSAPALAVNFLTTPTKIPAADSRPRVIIFGSVSCGWCRKLAADSLTDTALADVADKFVWLKIDVDEHEQFAARYGVTGLPQTVVTDAAGNVLGERAGYLPPAEYVAFLNDVLAHPKSTVSDLSRWLIDLKSSDEPTRREAVRSLLNHVSRDEGPGREQTIAELKSLGPPAAGEVAAYLEHPRLALRAAAAGLLQRSTSANRDFDPFASAALRHEQALAWNAWIIAQGGQIPEVSFIDATADASAWSPEGNADRPPAPPLAQPLEASGTTR